jgi:peroxiredoxin
MGSSASLLEKSDSNKSITPSQIKEGDKIPAMVFRVRVKLEDAESDCQYDFKNISTEDLFKGKRIILFSIPGAFSPTQVTDHLPFYESRYGK